MTGAELQAAIIGTAHLLGWKVAHFRPARTVNGWRTPVAADGAGWPDLVLVRDRVLFAEIKGDRDRLRPEQEAWLERLEQAGAEAYVWTPREWTAGTVETVLRTRMVPVPATRPAALSSSVATRATNA